MANHLFLIRHGKSEWNALGLWTGWTDVSLTEDGLKEARQAGTSLQSFTIDEAYVSNLVRTHQTLAAVQEGYEKEIPFTKHAALNERHYGIYTGKNKWQIKEQVGEEAFENIRRGWDVGIPEGETLKVVHDRVVPYYTEVIVPKLRAGKNILIVSHGNTLRALVKHIESIPESEVPGLEVATGEIIAYEMTPEGILFRLPLGRLE
jgi:2,3-bisphosphoglycerate-dependent phosphoglycerate mutase